MHPVQRLISLQCLALSELGPCLRSSRGSSLSIATTARLQRCFASQRIVPLIERRTRYPVIKNSLSKTLEAHRAVNRERLIRKVYNEEPNDGSRVADTREEVNPIPPSRLENKVVKNVKYRELLDVAEPSVSGRSSWVAPAPLIGKLAQYPWLPLPQEMDEVEDTAYSILNKEILALVQFLRPSQKEISLVNEIIEDVCHNLEGIVPTTPRLVGSRSTQIASSTSMIDLVILERDCRTPDAATDSSTSLSPRTSRIFITGAEQALKSNDNFQDMHIIHGKSPTLVMSHKQSGLSVRLFYQANSPKSDDYIRESIERQPQSLPIYMIMRVLLESKGLFGWDAASLEPYSLFLLVMSFLKQRDPKHANRGPGEHLLDFLRTYGTKVDLSTMGISAEPAQFFTPFTISEQERLASSSKNTSNGGVYPAYLVGQRALMRYKINAGNKANLPTAKHLCIQDPTNFLSDAGLRCLKTKELQQTLAGFYGDLRVTLEQPNFDRTGGILSRILRGHFDEMIKRKAVLEAL